MKQRAGRQEILWYHMVREGRQITERIKVSGRGKGCVLEMAGRKREEQVDRGKGKQKEKSAGRQRDKRQTERISDREKSLQAKMSSRYTERGKADRQTEAQTEETAGSEKREMQEGRERDR